MIAQWSDESWKFHQIANTDHNYDSASLSFDDDGKWRIISPTDPGPQPYGTGGEMVVYVSPDEGATWGTEKVLTAGSRLNHSYARRPVKAHPDFVALWADGNAREPSESRIYFCNTNGDVYRLPEKMDGEAAPPELVERR